MKNLKIRILKEIVGYDYTTIKRKLSIYNLTNGTNYALTDLGVIKHRDKYYFYGTNIEKLQKYNFFQSIGRWKRAMKYLENMFETFILDLNPYNKHDEVTEVIYANKPHVKKNGDIVVKNYRKYDDMDKEITQTAISDDLIYKFREDNLSYSSTEAEIIFRHFLKEKYDGVFCKD